MKLITFISFFGAVSSLGAGLTAPPISAPPNTLGSVPTQTVVSIISSSLATTTANGSIDTNGFLKSQVNPWWLDKLERTPKRVFTPNAEYLVITNAALPTLISSGARTNGFVWWGHDTEFWRITNGVVQRDANGLACFNTNGFPTGPIDWMKELKTNGLGIEVWYDNSSGQALRPSSTTVMINDLSNVVTWANSAEIDIGFRVDIEGTLQNIAYVFSQVLSSMQTNRTIHWNLGVGGLNQLQINPELFMLSDTVRLHGPEGDILNIYKFLIDMFPIVETNGYWRYTAPGSHTYVGSEANLQSGDAHRFVTNSAVYAAIMHHRMEINHVNPSSIWVGQATNLLAVNADPAQIPGRIFVQTNSLIEFVCPLGSPLGPSYAVAIFNTNTTAKTVDLKFNQYPKWFPSASYFVYDCVQNVQMWPHSTNVLQMSLGASNAALFRLEVNTNIPQSSVSGLVTALASKVDTNNIILYRPAEITSVTTASFTSDTGVSIPAGTYLVQGAMAARTASATAGINMQVGFSSAPALMSSRDVWGSKTTDPGVNVGAFITGPGVGWLLSGAFGGDTQLSSVGGDAPNKFSSSGFSALLRLTSPSTVKFAISQRSAIDAGNAVIMYTNSYAIFIPIAP